MKTRVINGASPDTFSEGSMHHFQPECTYKIQLRVQQKRPDQRYPHMEHIRYDHENYCNQHDNNTLEYFEKIISQE